MAINNFNVGVGTTSQLTRYRYVATGGETSISGADADGKTLSYTVGLEQVFLNGVNLVRGQDYTATNGTSIGNLTALVASDSLEVFAYVPFNIANAVTASTVDAKGDLLVGTAADTVGRLAVGTNDFALLAASGETTGLKWTDIGLGAWTSFTPTWTNLNAGNGTTTAKYIKQGKVVHFYVKLVLGSTSTVSGGPVMLNFPIAAASDAAGQGAKFTVMLVDWGTAQYVGGVIAQNANTTRFWPCAVNSAGTYTTGQDMDGATPFTWTTNDIVIIGGSYEAA